MSSSNVFKVGVIIGSARVVRVAPQVADFVISTIKSTAKNTSDPPINFDIVDLKTQSLPFFDEPHIPNQIKSPEGYTNEHTRVWSRRITGLDGFIFISPQRNWGYTPELKNAIDYLFNEWKGKPAMVVTYGGHGGNSSGDQLRVVLGSMGMPVAPQKIGMKFPDAPFRVKCIGGAELGLDAANDETPWAEWRPTIVSAWEDLVGKLGKGLPADYQGPPDKRFNPSAELR